MDSFSGKLDFSMQILLAHALRSEAGIIRQHFPRAVSVFKENSQELLKLTDGIYLLRTGVGLERCIDALNKVANLINYDLLIHFGVSGSLSDTLSISSLIQGNRFTCKGRPDLSAVPSPHADINIPMVSFYSSTTAITDEVSRETALRSGAEAVDMESYAAAQFCDTHQLPLRAIRCISDRAGATTPDDFKKHYSQAARILQEFLLTIILKQTQ